MKIFIIRKWFDDTASIIGTKHKYYKAYKI
jgi:hypothetical protein